VLRKFVLGIALGLSLLPLPVYSQDKKCAEPFRSPFRYAVFDNQVLDNNTGNPNDEWRSLGILLDEKSFSEATLKQLFQLLSKKYPKPTDLEVHVYTSLDQVPTPEEAEAGGMSEVTWCNDPHDKYHWANYLRKKDRESFVYNLNPPKLDTKLVVLKGKVP